MAIEGTEPPPKSKAVLELVGNEGVLSLIKRPPRDIFTRELPAIKDVIPDILPMASSLFIAPGNMGKSTQLAYLVACVALNLEIFGRQPRNGKVLVILGEDSTEDFWRILTLIGRNDPAMRDRGEELGESVMVLNQSDVSCTPRLVEKCGSKWQDGAWFEHMTALVNEYPSTRLIVLDTMSTLGIPEADGINDAAPAYHAAANKLCQDHELCVLAAGHVSQAKSENRELGMYSPRGGTSVADNARCVIQIQNHKEDDAKDYPLPFPGGIEGKYVTRWHIHKKKFSGLQDGYVWAVSSGYTFTTYGEGDLEDIARLRQKHREDAGTKKGDADDEKMLAVLRNLVEKDQEPTRDNAKAELKTWGKDRVKDSTNRLRTSGKVREKSIERSGKRGAPPLGFFPV